MNGLQGADISPQEAVQLSEMLVKLFFGAQIPAETSLAHIRSYRAQVEQAFAAVKTAERELPVQKEGMPGLPYWMMTVRLGVLVYEAALAWCDESEKTLEGLAGE